MTHFLTKSHGGPYVCSVCGYSWQSKPKDKAVCPGVHRYDWSGPNGRPDTLKTKTEWSKLGRVLIAEPVVGGAILRGDQNAYINLYDQAQTTESKYPRKPQATANQLEQAFQKLKAFPKYAAAELIQNPDECYYFLDFPRGDDGKFREFTLSGGYKERKGAWVRGSRAGALMVLNRLIEREQQKEVE